jgi:hypothetical protein
MTAADRAVGPLDLGRHRVDRPVREVDGRVIAPCRRHQDLGISGRREDQTVTSLAGLVDGRPRSEMMDILAFEQGDHDARVKD